MNRLARLLRHYFKLQAQETRTRLRANPFATVSLSHWTHGMTAALAPVLLPLAVRSGRATLRRLATHKRGRKDFGDPPRVGIGFQVFDSRVVEFIRHAVYLFCDATNATSESDVATSVAKLRQELSEGLSRGETAQRLTRRIQNIFNNPERAQMIAATETSRAVHGGALVAAKESGVVTAKKWLASSDACRICLELDGKEVPLDAPFAVEPGGGHYAIIMTPPRHPRCMCDMTQVI